MITQLSQVHDMIKDVFDLTGRMGNTHYLDFLYPDEIPKNKMKGCDMFDRDFIILKVGIYDDIVNNKKIKVESKHRVCKFRDYDRKEIASMDYWEDWAARIIQRQFIKCRYNPKYTICKKIVNRQFNEYLNGADDC